MMSDAVTVPPGLLIRTMRAFTSESSAAFFSSSRKRTSSGTRGGGADRTPATPPAAFGDASGCRVFFKCENRQRAGSFKIRGALNQLLTLTAAERARGVVAYSSGNHAQGVALAARMVGTTAIIC